MSSIRVLVAEMAPLHRDIVQRTAGKRSDMTIVGVVGGPVQAARVLDRQGADVLLLSASGPGPLRSYLDLVWAHPRLRLLVIDPADRRGRFRELRLTDRERPRVPWAEHLVDAIRSAAAGQ